MPLPPLPSAGKGGKGTAVAAVGATAPSTNECGYKSAINCGGKDMLFKFMYAYFQGTVLVPAVSLHLLN
jgi:hypothetical protein